MGGRQRRHLAPAVWARVSPSPEAGQIPSRPSGAGAGQAGDEVTAGRGRAGAATPGWGLGSRPWEQAAKRELGGEHTAAQRGRKKTNSRRPSRLERGLGCRFPGTGRGAGGSRPCSAPSEGPAQVVAGHGPGAGGWARGAGGPGTLRARTKSGTVRGKLRQREGARQGVGVVVKCLADSAPTSCFL